MLFTLFPSVHAHSFSGFTPPMIASCLCCSVTITKKEQQPQTRNKCTQLYKVQSKSNKISVRDNFCNKNVKISPAVLLSIFTKSCVSKANCHANPFFYRNVNDIVVDWQILWRTLCSPILFYCSTSESVWFLYVRSFDRVCWLRMFAYSCNRHMFIALKATTLHMLSLLAAKTPIF